MKIKTFLITYFILLTPLFGQNYNPFIAEIINEVNLDSLISYVRILSGEDSVVINNSLKRIYDRTSDKTGNYLAAEYLKEKLTSFGLDVYEQNYSDSGNNIYAIQKGVNYPDSYFIYGAHYDAVHPYSADDNASGVANVIEAARILSTRQVSYSIIYALWDEEEIGRRGSRYFASSADSNGMNIVGVINSEMSGYDSDNDGLMDIHSSDSGRSHRMAEIMYRVDSVYNIPLNPVVYDTGSRFSDHASFWEKGYSAIQFCQAFFGGDFNPNYHSRDDRIAEFNFSYFYNMSVYGLAVLTTLALDNPLVKADEEELEFLKPEIKIYPNPFNSETNISFTIPQEDYVNVVLYNSIGQEVRTLFRGVRSPGEFELLLNADGLSSGIYFVILKAPGFLLRHKIVYLK
jgi:hypothetical protein